MMSVCDVLLYLKKLFTGPQSYIVELQGNQVRCVTGQLLFTLKWP